MSPKQQIEKAKKIIFANPRQARPAMLRELLLDPCAFEMKLKRDLYGRMADEGGHVWEDAPCKLFCVFAFNVYGQIGFLRFLRADSKASALLFACERNGIYCAPVNVGNFKWIDTLKDDFQQKIQKILLGTTDATRLVLLMNELVRSVADTKCPYYLTDRGELRALSKHNLGAEKNCRYIILNPA